ncbi:MAG TPA: hypothetical protein VF613_02040 [Longimicrobium sp.]
MQHPAPAEPPQAPPARHIRLPAIIEGGGWRNALREFGIIVAGVLCALGAQAWWEQHEERGRERDYLRQILADTRENESRLAEAIERDSAGVGAAARIMDALTRPEAPLPPDSMMRWMGQAGRSADFRPVAGNYRALLGTGELRLVRTDTLRALLASYASSVDAEADRQRQFRETMTGAAGPMARAMPFMRRAFVGGMRLDEAELRRIRGDPEVVGILFTMQAAISNRVSGLRSLRNETLRLRAALEAELRAGEP